YPLSLHDALPIFAPLGTSLDFEEFGVALHFVAKPRKKPKRLEILKRDLVALLRQRSLASARAVTINGIPTVGTKTTLTAGTYEAPPTGRSYQWQFCEPGYAHCADIPDATHPTYTPGAPPFARGGCRPSTAAPVSGQGEPNRLPQQRSLGPASGPDPHRFAIHNAWVRPIRVRP